MKTWVQFLVSQTNKIKSPSSPVASEFLLLAVSSVSTSGKSAVYLCRGWGGVEANVKEGFILDYSPSCLFAFAWEISSASRGFKLLLELQNKYPIIRM